MSQATHDSHAEAHAHAEHKHPSVAAYTLIAIILFVITGVEIGASVYPPLLVPERHSLLIFTLVGLGTVKFFTVVGYFMHLKFDARVYTRLFVAPLIVASLVGIVLVVLQQAHKFVMP